MIVFTLLGKRCFHSKAGWVIHYTTSVTIIDHISVLDCVKGEQFPDLFDMQCINNHVGTIDWNCYKQEVTTTTAAISSCGVLESCSYSKTSWQQVWFILTSRGWDQREKCALNVINTHFSGQQCFVDHKECFNCSIKQSIKHCSIEYQLWISTKNLPYCIINVYDAKMPKYGEINVSYFIKLVCASSDSCYAC